jgi:predicted Zn-dependent peptidase
MIDFQRFILENGLRVIIHEDNSTPLVAVNMLYDVGSRDENPQKTGFAHLFEHLMFAGSKNAPDFDSPIQQAGGENNAFTNTDMTNFYATVPAENLETLLWLESDRMLALNINKRSLNVQRKVVVEEFKETTLDEPYGDMWHHLSALSYKKHPYRWPVIGLEPAHIEQATLKEVKFFYSKFYVPNNAILVVSGNLSKHGNTEGVLKQIEKWFGNIPKGSVSPRKLPKEPVQKKMHRQVLNAQVPLDALYMGFHTPSRFDPDYYAVDLMTDVLANGSSSRFYRKLLKEKRLFSEIDCAQAGYLDPSLVIIDGKPTEGVMLETAEQAIWEELNLLKNELIDAQELQKLKNKIESQQAFSDAAALSKAMNLAYYELLGDADLINKEMDMYNAVTEEDIQRVAKKIFTEENSSVLYYKAVQGKAMA